MMPSRHEDLSVRPDMTRMLTTALAALAISALFASAVVLSTSPLSTQRAFAATLDTQDAAVGSLAGTLVAGAPIPLTPLDDTDRTDADEAAEDGLWLMPAGLPQDEDDYDGRGDDEAGPTIIPSAGPLVPPFGKLLGDRARQ